MYFSVMHNRQEIHRKIQQKYSENTTRETSLKVERCVVWKESNGVLKTEMSDIQYKIETKKTGE